jgi:hypothetical protein
MHIVPRHADLYHTGIVVTDIEETMAEYERVLGVTWGFSWQALPPDTPEETPILTRDGARTIRFQFAYTSEGPHRLELVQTIPDTIWAVPSPGAHHIGFWSGDIAADSAQLTAAGAPWTVLIGVTEKDERPTAVMHRLPSGLHVELVDRAMASLMFPGG